MNFSSPTALSSNESTGDEYNEDLGDFGKDNFSMSGSISSSPVLLTTVLPSTSTQTFCSVPGRLSLLCASSKYKVSVAEVLMLQHRHFQKQYSVFLHVHLLLLRDLIPIG
ncbi:unnamed protein product [Onchocerca flexuosa]|uniref:TF_AP-2 domain-containing protein n=1 Tax=Onchocerca flexuosa TaxID=387005 RepID=A0A183HKU9_9BILA|nr:unnamed protein product [Onchocerca flexuosa]